MSDFVAKDEDLKATVQALLEGMKMARSLENLATSLIPLADTQDAIAELSLVEQAGVDAAAALRNLYKRTAREAFGEHPLPGTTRQPPRDRRIRGVSEQREDRPDSAHPAQAPARPALQPSEGDSKGAGVQSPDTPHGND